MVVVYHVQCAAFRLLPHLIQGCAASSPVPHMRGVRTVEVTPLSDHVKLVLQEVIADFPLKSSDVKSGTALPRCCSCPLGVC